MDSAMSTLLPRPIRLELGEVNFIDRENSTKPEEEKDWLWHPICTKLQEIASSALDRPKELIQNTFGRDTTAMNTPELLQRAKSCLRLHTRNSIDVAVYPELSGACEELQTEQNKMLNVRYEEEGPTFGNRTTRVEIEASFLPSDPFMSESGTVTCLFQVFLGVFRFFHSIPGEEWESAQLHQYTAQVMHKLSLDSCVRPDQEGSSRDDSLITGPKGKSTIETVSDSTAPSVEGTRLDDPRADSQSYGSDANTGNNTESAARPS